MLKYRRSFRYCDIEDGRWVDFFHQQVDRAGFGRALLSMVREDTLGDQQAVYRQLQTNVVPVQILRGSQDAIMTKTQFEGLQTTLPRASYQQVSDTAHAFCFIHPQQVAAPMLRFLLAN